MIRIAIVDDEVSCSTALADFVQRYFNKNKEEYSVNVFSDGLEFISFYKGGYELVFMDIKMKSLNGMHTAISLRKIDRNIVLVFVTQMMQYAIQGYEVDAFDFIVKPVDYYSFEMKMNRIMNELRQRECVTILVSQHTSAQILKSSEIYFIEVYGHNITYHTSLGIFKGRGSLAELEKKLAPVYFRLCHRCYLVNLAYVSKIKENSILVQGEEVPLSRLKKKEFFNMLADYYGRNV